MNILARHVPAPISALVIAAEILAIIIRSFA